MATSDGQLVLLDGAGKEVRRTPLWAAANREKHVLKPSPQYRKLANPREYQEPGTLELAQRDLHAQALAAWKPTEETGVERFGKTFHTVAGPISISGEAPTRRASCTSSTGGRRAARPCGS